MGFRSFDWHQGRWLSYTHCCRALTFGSASLFWFLHSQLHANLLLPATYTNYYKILKSRFKYAYTFNIDNGIERRKPQNLLIAYCSCKFCLVIAMSWSDDIVMTRSNRPTCRRENTIRCFAVFYVRYIGWMVQLSA